MGFGRFRDCDYDRYHVSICLGPLSPASVKRDMVFVAEIDRSANFSLCVFFSIVRFIVFRRIFFLAGIHYFYRSVTFYVTVLPKADPTYKCAPKSEHLTFVVIAQRVLKLLGGMGLSINGRHVYCGDYIYSGHTMTLLMTYLVIQECKYS